MDNTNQAIVSLTSHKVNAAAKIELDGVRRSLSMLSWNLQTQQVLSFAGLPVSEAVLAENAAVQVNSHAYMLGHTTLQSLVEKPESEDGLGLNWAEFSLKMTALVNSQKYAIQERDYQEINALVEDATSILQRKPVDVAEFHSAKQRALQDQIVTIQRESQARTQDLQEKNGSLMRSLTDAQTEISGLHDSNTKMMQDAADRITAMTREMAMNQEVFERKANERVQEEAARLEGEFAQALARKQNELAMEFREADNKRMQAENRFNEVQLRIDRGDLISSQLLRDAESRLEEARGAEAKLRNQLLDLNGALTEAQKVILALKDEKNDLLSEVEKLNALTASQESRIRGIIEDKLGSSEFAVLQERLSIIRSENNELETRLKASELSAEKQTHTLNQLRGRFLEMKSVGREHFNELKGQLTFVQEQNALLTQRYTNAKVIMALLGVVSVSGITALALSLSGMI